MPPHNKFPQNPIDNQNILITQIASGLTTTAELVQSLSSEIRDNTISLATVRAELTNVTGDVKTLSKILREGNGSLPVLTRLALVEHEVSESNKDIKTIEKDISEIKDKLNALYQSYNTSLETTKLSIEDKKSKRQVLIAIVTSIIALIAAILSAVLT